MLRGGARHLPERLGLLVALDDELDVGQLLGGFEECRRFGWSQATAAQFVKELAF